MSQTWAAPDPAPAAVTHLRDRYDVLWRRDDDLWWGDVGNGFEKYRTWWELLARGPLTDATGEA